MISLNTIKNIFILIAGIAIGAFLFKGCGKSCPCDGKVISTVTKSGSVTKTLPAETSTWHKLQPVDSFKGLEGGDIEKAIKTGQYRESLVHAKLTPAQLSDTAQDENNIPAIWSDYLDSFDYNEDYHFNSGDVHVETHVSANRIDSQRVILSNVKEKVITNTVTVTKEVEAAKHNEIYLGVSAMGNLQMPFYAFGPSLSFKTKSDRVLEAGVLYTRNSSIMYQFGIKTKLSLHKN